MFKSSARSYKTSSGISFSAFILLCGVILLVGLAIVVYARFIRTSTVKTVPLTRVTVAGSGSATFALQKWIDYFNKTVDDVEFIPLPSADTAAGLRGLKEKTLDIATLSREPETDELFPELKVTKLARDAVVFAVHPSVENISNLTGDQLAEIYSGKILNWKDVGGADARIIVIDRNEQESSKKQFRDLYLKDSIVVKNAIITSSEKDMLTALSGTPNSIGYLSYGRAKATDIKVLLLDGIRVEDGMKSGTYPMPRSYFVGTRTDSSSAIKTFVHFLESNGKTLTDQFHYF